ncbi:hypothetical protein F53441_6730 [Fusarium austroafricanum]|uniref:Uncharacterized protein n=1 Tax=Fusarium austroafricanum TaxID=2364996 RepID=A0A8H4KHW1_9HYPO|nr:hypothetical protein F53441_6730 [Fusarium austroafricanum]
MSYHSGPRHYHEPLPLRARLIYRPPFFSQCRRKKRPQPFDLGLNSNFAIFGTPASPLSPVTSLEPFYKALDEFEAMMAENERRRGDQTPVQSFLEVRKWLTPPSSPHIDRFAVNILEPPNRIISPCRCPKCETAASGYNESPTYLTPREYSPISQHTPVAFTPRSPTIGGSNSSDIWRPVVRHISTCRDDPGSDDPYSDRPYRDSPGLNERPVYGSLEEELRDSIEEDVAQPASSEFWDDVTFFMASLAICVALVFLVEYLLFILYLVHHSR